MPLLTLADEYQADQVKARCQDYIGGQLTKHYRKHYRVPNKVADQTPPPACAFGGSTTSARVFGTLTPPARVFGTSTPPARVFGNSTPSATQPASPVSPVSPWVDQLTLYLWMCDQYQLPRYRAEVMSLLLEAIRRLDDVAKGVHYASLPLQTRVDLLEALCRKLDGSHT